MPKASSIKSLPGTKFSSIKSLPGTKLNSTLQNQKKTTFGNVGKINQLETQPKEKSSSASLNQNKAIAQVQRSSFVKLKKSQSKSSSKVSISSKKSSQKFKKVSTIAIPEENLEQTFDSFSPIDVALSDLTLSDSSCNYTNFKLSDSDLSSAPSSEVSSSVLDFYPPEKLFEHKQRSVIGCVSDNDAVKSLPDDWVPVKGMGQALKEYLENQRILREETESALYKECEELNATIDESMKIEIRTLNGEIAFFAAELLKIIDLNVNDINEVTYEKLKIAIAIKLDVILQNIELFRYAMKELESKRIDGIKKNLTENFTKLAEIANESIENNFNSTIAKIKITNEQISHNFETIATTGYNASQQCRDIHQKTLARLEEIWIKSQIVQAKDELAVSSTENINSELAIITESPLSIKSLRSTRNKSRSKQLKGSRHTLKSASGFSAVKEMNETI